MLICLPIGKVVAVSVLATVTLFGLGFQVGYAVLRMRCWSIIRRCNEEDHIARNFEHRANNKSEMETSTIMRNFVKGEYLNGR